MNLAAALRDEGAVSGPAKVIDISLDGCRIEAEQPMGPDAEVWLKLPGLETKRARVCWVNGKEAGCEFDTPLHPAELELMVPAKKLVKPKRLFTPLG